MGEVSLVVDITELHDHPIHTGIQRVVREMLGRWITRRKNFHIVRFDPRVGLVVIVPEAIRLLLDQDQPLAPRDVVRRQLAEFAAIASPLAIPDDALVFLPEVFFQPERVHFHAARLSRNPASLAMLAYDFLPWLRPGLFTFGISRRPMVCMDFGRTSSLSA